MTQGRFKKLQEAEEHIYSLEETIKDLYLEVDYLEKIIDKNEDLNDKTLKGLDIEE